ncbi:DNA polymerase III subunit gamma/tau [Thermodesulfobacteriota bacterium]
MAYEVLARKWRPQVFEDVVGQRHVTQTLANALKSDRLAHAFLFGGPRGVGKTSVARILAKAINCEKGEPAVPCNVCRSCREITDGSSVDVQEIDGASNRGIDEIRDLRDGIRYMPSSSRYRVFIIDEVHMLTLPAFNALLKTLEEPPEHVKFIFATTESHKVPITIHSRCQRFDFKRIPLMDVVEHLEKIAREEEISISKGSLVSIAREAGGSMRDAESLLDQVTAYSGSVVEDKEVPDILGIIDREIVFKVSEAILEGSIKECLEIVEKIYNSGYDVKEFYRVMMNQFRNLLVNKISPESQVLDMTEDERKVLGRQAGKVKTEKLQIILNFLIAREESLRFTSNPRIILETIIIKLCRLDDYLSFGELMGKIESMEKRLSGKIREEGNQGLGYISDPGKDWNKGSGKNENPGGIETLEGEAGWEGLLKFLFSKSKSMYNILRDWQLIGLTGKKLEIRGSNQAFSSTYFDKPENYEQLVKYCRDFFQRPVRVEIKKSKVIDKNKGHLKEKESAVPKTQESEDLSSPVKNILEMFEGEIKKGPSGKEREVK